MLTCELTDIANSDCQGITQVYDYYPKDEQCYVPKCEVKKKPKNITLLPRSPHNECDTEIIGSLHNTCKPVSPPVVSSTTSSVMATNSHKRQKKCRREYGHHKKRARSVTEETNDCISESATNLISPKVTPIFVWANVEDTKIVHVLCEDYDKRNRIRLTRTAKGWRSVPLIESLEKCRQMSTSQSPPNSASPKLVHNSPTTSDNRLQTDNLSNYPTENEFSQGESIGAVADSTNPDHNFNDVVPQFSSSRDDAFSSDEEGQQEDLRSMIDKMQSDSLYSDEECEVSVSTTQDDRMIEDTPYQCIYSSKNFIESENLVPNKKTEEDTLPSPKIMQENTLHQGSDNFPDNSNMCESSINSEMVNTEERVISNSALSSKNILHPELNSKVSDSNIILDMLNRDDTSKLIESSHFSALTDNSNQLLDNHNQVRTADQFIKNTKEETTPSQQAISSVSKDFHNNLEKGNVMSEIDRSCDVFEETVLSTKELSESEGFSNYSSDDKNNCNSEISIELSSSSEVASGIDDVPISHFQDRLSNHFVDSNANIINYSICDALPPAAEESIITSCCKSLTNDKTNESSSNTWTDDNANIISESTVINEISDNIEDTVTSPLNSIPENVPCNHLDNSLASSENSSLSKVNGDHSDSDELYNLTSIEEHTANHQNNTNIDAYKPKYNDQLSDRERLPSPSLMVSPSPDNGITLHERYSNLAKTENSILSTLLQTDIIVEKLADENSRNEDIEKDGKNLERIVKPEMPLPSFKSVISRKNSKIENKNHQPDMSEEHSRTMEFLYRSYFESPFMIQGRGTKELLQSLHVDDECMDLSIHRKNMKDSTDNRNISVGTLLDEESGLLKSELLLEASRNPETSKDDKRFNYNDIQSSCNPFKVKAEDIHCNELALCEKSKVDTTVLKVPLCQTLKSSNKCANTRRLLIRKQSKLSEDDNISDEVSFKELSSIPYLSQLSSEEAPSTDIKPGYQNNVLSNKDATSPVDKSQLRPFKLPKYQPPDLTCNKITHPEREKHINLAKMKPYPTTVSAKDKNTALDPLEQLKDVLSNPMYSVPDPLLVPKARLPALVTCPGREIPRLLARRAQNSSYVSILSDPDVLVVSLSHLRSLITKPLNENDIQEYQKHTEEIRSRLRLELLNYKASQENASLFGASWNDYHSSLSVTPVPSSKSISNSKVNSDDLFRGLNLTYNPLNLSYPGDIGRDINGNCGTPYLYEKGPLPWPNDILSGHKSNPPMYDPCGVSWTDQLCAHLGCFQTAPGTCSLGRNDLLYCPFDSQLRSTFSPYMHSTLSCANSMPVLRDIGTKNYISEFCYPWMDLARCTDDKGHTQPMENPFEHVQYPSKIPQSVLKSGVDLKMESGSFDKHEKVGPKIQPKDGSSAVEDLPDKRGQSDKRGQLVEPKIKVRQHLVDPNRRPLLLNPQSRSPYDSSAAPFLRPWSNESHPHPFSFSETDKKNKKFQWTTPVTRGTS